MKKILSLLCVFLLAVSVAACSKKVDVSGDYHLLRIDAETNPVTEEQMEMLRANGMDVTLTLDADGKGTMSLFGEEMEVTYDLAKGTATVGTMEEEFKTKDGQILISDVSGTMVFVKDTE